MTSNFSRTIWSERGIDISMLETTDIPNSVRCLKWGNFILSRPQYYPEIVRAFYAALVPKTFEESGTVFVQGRKVVITAKLINEHFCTPEVPKTNFMVYETREELFSKFLSKLRWDELDESLELRYEELHPEMALWTMFINHNLIPSSNQTVVSSEVDKILFCIKSGIPIDVGRIIHEQICDANDGDSSLLPFPSLINHFCLLSGVTIRGDLWSPLPDIGIVLYNSFAQQQDLPTLPSRKRLPTMPVQPQGRVPSPPLQPPGRVLTTPVQPHGGVPTTPVQPLTNPWQGQIPSQPLQPPGRVLTTPVQPQGGVPTTPVQPQGGVPTPPVRQQGRVPTTPVQPLGRVPAMPVQPSARPLANPWQGRVPTTPVQPQGRVPTVQGRVPTVQGQVPTMQVQLQHGNMDRPKWVNEISGRLNSLSNMIVSQCNALSTQINNIGMRVTSLEDAMRGEEFEDLDSHRRVRLRSTE